MSRHFLGFEGPSVLQLMGGDIVLEDDQDSTFIGSVVNPFENETGGGARLLAEFYFVNGMEGYAPGDDAFWTLKVFNHKGPTIIDVVRGCPEHIRKTYRTAVKDSGVIPQ